MIGHYRDASGLSIFSWVYGKMWLHLWKKNANFG